MHAWPLHHFTIGASLTTLLLPGSCHTLNLDILTLGLFKLPRLGINANGTYSMVPSWLCTSGSHSHSNHYQRDMHLVLNMLAISVIPQDPPRASKDPSSWVSDHTPLTASQVKSDKAPYQNPPRRPSLFPFCPSMIGNREFASQVIPNKRHPVITQPSTTLLVRVLAKTPTLHAFKGPNLHPSTHPHEAHYNQLNSPLSPR